MRRIRTSWPGHGTDRGASTVEYALIVFAVAATIVLAVVSLGPPVLGMYDGTCRAVKGGATGPASTCQ